MLLCNRHKRAHNDDDQEHNIIKLKLKVSEELKKKVLDSVGAKIRLVDQFSTQIIQSSSILVEQLKILTKSVLSKFEDQRKKYLQILNLLDTELIEEQLKHIEKEAESLLIYAECEVHRLYEQEILQLGRDLIQEVAKTSLICLETREIWARVTGMIREDGFVYEGKIENGLRHGRGKCKYEDGAVYNGEFQKGKAEGRGVFTSSLGEVYDGEWKAGLKEGRGIWKSPNGDIYDGEFKNGSKEGRGVYKFVSVIYMMVNGFNIYRLDCICFSYNFISY